MRTLSQTRLTRWKAAAIHLAISAVIGATVGLIVFGVWFPPPYFTAAGGEHLTLVLVCVDLVLGPLLTLIVFKAGKRGLAFDLTVIALAQLTALAYGLYVISSSRPIFLVANLDRFVLVTANQIDDADLAKGSAPEFRACSWSGMRLVGARIPDDAARQRLIDAMLGQGKDVQNFPEYFVPYADISNDLVKHAHPLDTLIGRPAARPIVEAWLAEHHRAAADIVWLPVTAHVMDLTMLLDRSTGQPLQALQVDPW
jgi:hypothetical protein